MFENIILGAIQGITEWIPVSSKACIIAARIHLFHNTGTLNELINYALFLHLGTALAAIIYFREDIAKIFSACGDLKNPASEGRKILIFLVTVTVFTAFGQVLVTKASDLAHRAPHAKAAITCIIAALLIVAGFLQLKTKTEGKRETKDLTLIDGIILGIVQAFTCLPGLSRAGTTMAALAVRNFDKEHTLKLSFLMSIPVILLGNIIKNHHLLLSARSEWLGVLTAFVVGMLSIGVLMNFVKKVNFGGFLIFIGSILAVATILGAID
ncbi:MAG: undecaprenyl-diphosphate phosphatase [Candidatus Omnitrophica bacterium]|nr:undecaprenyl-diphosphate phosphatase [Candidatus Omnitrophota bacterium]